MDFDDAFGWDDEDEWGNDGDNDEPPAATQEIPEEYWDQEAGGAAEPTQIVPEAAVEEAPPTTTARSLDYGAPEMKKPLLPPPRKKPKRERSPSPVGWRGEAESPSTITAMTHRAKSDDRRSCEPSVVPVRQQQEPHSTKLLLAPPENESVTLTMLDGTRYHVATGCAEVEKEAARMEKEARTGLLDRSVESLREDLAAPVEEEAPPSAKKKRRRSSLMEEEKSSILWVEKYSAGSFAELLTEERTNRDVLRHIKEWDPYVFNRKAPAPPAPPVPFAPRFPPSNNQKSNMSMSMSSSTGGRRFEAKKPLNGGLWKGGDDPMKRRALDQIGGSPKKQSFFQQQDLAEEEVSSDGRPLKRIILLSGEAGTGKTTLAHVLAKQCGYRVHEINASNDRTGPVLVSSIESATSNRSLTSSAPTCVLLDELDGADGKSAVAAVVAMANAAVAVKKQDDEEGVKKKKREKKTPALTRPLICICNDAWAPHMRQLRDVAHCFAFNKKGPSSRRLVERLRCVAAKEGLPVTPAALSALAEASEGDVRACLHAMQMASAVGDTSEKVSRAVYAAIATGLKDRRSADFELWRTVFSRVNIAKKRTAITKSLRVEKEVSSLSRVFDAVQRSGESEHLLDAVLENYAHLPSRDASLRSTSAMLDDLGEGDLFMARAYANSQFELAKYAGLVGAGSAHARCRVDSAPRMVPPRASRRPEFEKNDAILTSLDEGRGRRLGRCALALDLAPFLVKILNDGCRGFREVTNVGILRLEEKRSLDRSVQILLSNGLNLERCLVEKEFVKPERPLRPDLESVVSKFSNNTTMLSLQKRAMLFRELTTAQLRKKQVEPPVKPKMKPWEPPEKKKKPMPVSDLPPAKAAFSFADWGLTTKTAAKQRDMDKQREQGGPNAPAQPTKRRLIYKFNKGYTNAIRRPVNMEDLFN